MVNIKCKSLIVFVFSTVEWTKVEMAQFDARLITSTNGHHLLPHKCLLAKAKVMDVATTMAFNDVLNCNAEELKLY